MVKKKDLQSVDVYDSFGKTKLVVTSTIKEHSFFQSNLLPQLCTAKVVSMEELWPTLQKHYVFMTYINVISDWNRRRSMLDIIDDISSRQGHNHS